MEPRKYHQIRRSRAGNDTWKFIKEQKALELPIISIATIVNGGSVVYKYYDILMALSYEFGALIIMFGVLFLWKSLRVVPEHIYNEQQKTIKSKQKTIELLEEQQKPKLQIGFDLEKFPSCLDDTSRAYEDQTGKTVRVAFSQKWRIFVYNSSTTETIKNVEVKLIDINKCLSGEARNLPAVHLKFTHDSNRKQRSISINPKSRKFVDVIECFMTSGQIKENIFYVQHIEKNQNHSDLSLFFNNINKEDCKVRIEVEGEDTTCKPKDFVIGLRGEVIKMWEA